MSKTPFIPPIPHIDPPDKETLEKLKNFDHKEFEKSKAYKKYVVPVLEREKKMKHHARVKWWKENWIQVVTLIIGVLTLIATVLFGVLSLLH